MAKKLTTEITVNMIREIRAKTSAGMSLCKEALMATDGDMVKAVDYVNDRSDVVSRLHNETGARIVLCKVAFADAGKDFEKAVELINQRGWADESGKGSSTDKPQEGLIEAYIHGTDRKTVSLVEVTCKTDFVAKHEFVRDFAHAVALHVAAMKPKYIARENVSEEVVKEMKELFAKEIEAEGGKKPANIIEKIMDGKLEKFYTENCLMEQKSLRDDTKTIQNLLDELIGKVGEPIKIRRILCWSFGE